MLVRVAEGLAPRGAVRLPHTPYLNVRSLPTAACFAVPMHSMRLANQLKSYSYELLWPQVQWNGNNIVDSSIAKWDDGTPEPAWFFLPAEGGSTMQRVNVFPFYQLGWRLHPLIGIEEGHKVKEWQSRLYMAQSWLEYILEGQIIPLAVSKPAAQSLITAIKAILEREIPEQAGLYNLASLASLTPPPPPSPEERELTWLEAYNVRSGVQTFETVLGADLESLSTYFVSPKLGYDTRVLIENAGNLLP